MNSCWWSLSEYNMLLHYWHWRLHRCCHLPNKVENIYHMPDIPYTLQLPGDAPKIAPGDPGPHLTHCSSDSPESIPQTTSRLVVTNRQADERTDRHTLIPQNIGNNTLHLVPAMWPKTGKHTLMQFFDVNTILGMFSHLLWEFLTLWWRLHTAQWIVTTEK